LSRSTRNRGQIHHVIDLLSSGGIWIGIISCLRLSGNMSSFMSMRRRRFIPSVACPDAPDADGSVWMFPNPDTGCPLVASPDSAALHPQGRNGSLNLDHIGWHGWHTFRNTYSSLLRGLGVDLKCSRSCCARRYSHTMNLYTQAVPAHLRDQFKRGAARPEPGCVN
jgi:hypothetical protein